MTMHSWSTRAINLPEHADNPVHTDEGAIAAGFPSAIVAGTTVYAYMTHPVVAAWGEDWLTGGGGELRLRRPVFHDDPVDCVVAAPAEDGSGHLVSADVGGDSRATLEVWRAMDPPAHRDGTRLKDVQVALTEERADYGMRAGDDLTRYAERSIVPPVTWVDLANRVFIENLVTGPWVHVRSRIVHQGLAPRGTTARLESILVDRFDSRAGERALVDVRIFADDQPVATIEHEAIIVLA